jgi:hypothetical protein
MKVKADFTVVASLASAMEIMYRKGEASSTPTRIRKK